MIASLLIMLFPLSVFAESGMYRIEVLVFQHLDNDAEAKIVERLRAFEDSPDLIDDYNAQPAPYRLDVQSSAMQDVWRRLRNSASFKPLWFASWEQTRIDYHPPVRIHDEEVVLERLQVPDGPAFLDLRESDPLDAYRESLYRLDGTVQLSRTRFLHLDLDLEFRVALESSQMVLSDNGGEILANQSAPTDPEGAEGLSPEQETQVSALIHNLKQSRQVRSGQMLYFDSPFMGVLARITATSGE